MVAHGPHGVRILVNPLNPPEVSVYLWGTYEPEVMSALEFLVRPGTTVVDVGANCGVLSVVMGRLAGSASVIAIDPSPFACARVREQAQFNDLSITALSVALGSSSGEQEYFFSEIGIGALPDVDRALTTSETVSVTVVSLDEILADQAPGGVSLIKIDTDGSEEPILRGASDTLTRWRPAIVFEFFLAGMTRRGVRSSDLMDTLECHAYELFAPVFRPQPFWRVGPRVLDRFVRATRDDLMWGKLDGRNLVALPSGSQGEEWRMKLLGSQ